MRPEIQFYEELAINTHPALQTQLYDGWVLRFSNGYTNRANSVSPLYPSNLPGEEKVAHCEQIYAAQELPAVFKLTDASPAGLETYFKETRLPSDIANARVHLRRTVCAKKPKQRENNQWL